MHYSTLLSVAIAAFTLTPSILTHAIPKPIDINAPASDLAIRADDDGPPPMGSNDEALAKYIEDAMETIASIPDSVLDAGDEAVSQWAVTHGAGSTPQSQSRSVDTTAAPLEKRQGWLQVAKCALAIGKAIAENAFPISKLRRIKELIGVLGGARQVAKMLLKAKSIKQMLIIGGPELQEIAEILLGVGDVVRACFEF
ncbi:MAG: hypothetical protein Q9207_008439 [Kuettlingeria erythrocarpa]